MDININTFMYLFVRLCPFILVCFFAISSIFNNDIKGIVYLMGLLFAIGIIIIVNNLLPDWLLTATGEGNPICNIISFGTSELSKLPIGEAIISFTFLYLLTTMISVGNEKGTNLVASNWPTVLFFSVLIMIELYQNTNIFEGIIKYFKPETVIKYCYDWKTSLITYTIGGLLGWVWAAIILSTNTPEIQYFNKYKHNEKCEKAKKNTFACKVYKNGEEVLDKDTIAKYITNSNI